MDIYENIVIESCSDQHQFNDSLRNADEVSVEFSGKYSLVVTNKTIESMRNNDDIYVTWSKDKKGIERWRNLLSAQGIGKGNPEKARGNELVKDTLEKAT